MRLALAIMIYTNGSESDGSIIMNAMIDTGGDHQNNLYLCDAPMWRGQFKTAVVNLDACSCNLNFIY